MIHAGAAHTKSAFKCSLARLACQFQYQIWLKGIFFVKQKFMCSSGKSRAISSTLTGVLSAAHYQALLPESKQVWRWSRGSHVPWVNSPLITVTYSLMAQVWLSCPELHLPKAEKDGNFCYRENYFLVSLYNHMAVCVCLCVCLCVCVCKLPNQYCQVKPYFHASFCYFAVPYHIQQMSVITFPTEWLSSV